MNLCPLCLLQYGAQSLSDQPAAVLIVRMPWKCHCSSTREGCLHTFDSHTSTHKRITGTSKMTSLERHYRLTFGSGTIPYTEDNLLLPCYLPRPCAAHWCVIFGIRFDLALS